MWKKALLLALVTGLAQADDHAFDPRHVRDYPAGVDAHVGVPEEELPPRPGWYQREHWRIQNKSSSMQTVMPSEANNVRRANLVLGNRCECWGKNWRLRRQLAVHRHH